MGSVVPSVSLVVDARCANMGSVVPSVSRVVGAKRVSMGNAVLSVSLVVDETCAHTKDERFGVRNVVDKGFACTIKENLNASFVEEAKRATMVGAVREDKANMKGFVMFALSIIPCSRTT